jgi:uncharacterized membrane protein YhdT
MGMIRLKTKWIIGLVILGLILWDIFAYLFGKNATISVVITDFSKYTPWVPFLFGVLMGHWFFPAKGSND